MKFGSFVLTRDSALWFWGKIVGIAGLVVAGTVDLHAFGLSDQQQHLVMGLCAAILGLSAQLATSQLPGQKDLP